MNIGDNVFLNKTVVTIVDFNEGAKKVKVKIKGFQEDKRSEKIVYIWLDYKDIEL